jgi:hypothetical protein
VTKSKHPPRPETPDHQAIIAHETILLFILTRMERASPQLERIRNVVLQSVAARPARPDDQAILDHVDWLLAVAQSSFRGEGE